MAKAPEDKKTNDKNNFTTHKEPSLTKTSAFKLRVSTSKTDSNENKNNTKSKTKTQRANKILLHMKIINQVRYIKNKIKHSEILTNSIHCIPKNKTNKN